MRQFLLILLLALLPLQWASAALDVACLQESPGQALPHFELHADASDAGGNAEQAAQQHAADCHHLIHHADCHAVISQVPPLKLDAARVYLPQASHSPQSVITAEPERPNWRYSA